MPIPPSPGGVAGATMVSVAGRAERFTTGFR